MLLRGAIQIVPERVLISRRKTEESFKQQPAAMPRPVGPT
jgi:hypothetical protein